MLYISQSLRAHRVLRASFSLSVPDVCQEEEHIARRREGRRVGVSAYRPDYVAGDAYFRQTLGPTCPDDPIREQDAAWRRRPYADTPIRRHADTSPPKWANGDVKPPSPPKSRKSTSDGTSASSVESLIAG